jgi:long-chain fatty acid transport protein
MKLKFCGAGMAAIMLLLAVPGSASAAGFAISDDGASGLGEAYAGGAAIADDVSTIYTNPSGMSRLQDQYTVALQAIDPTVTFSPNSLNQGAAMQTAGGNGGNPSNLAVVPNVHIVKALNSQLKFGFSLNTPFGLQTNYDPTWVGRFQALKSSLETINLNPSLSYQLSDKVAIGAGLSYQHITGELSQAVNYTFLSGGLAAGEGVSTAKGSDYGFGYNFGALIDLDKQTRVGFSYRSEIKYRLKGDLTFTNVPGALAGAVANGPITVDLPMPALASASVVHELSPQTDVMADLTWTGWSAQKTLNVVRSDGTLVSSTPEYWHNTWRISAGASHRYNEQWLARIGVAFDQSPISSTYRNARLPGSNRRWIALGGQYKPGRDSAVDFAYVHMFMNNASIYQDQTATGAGILSGTYSLKVELLSVQYTQGF